MGLRAVWGMLAESVVGPGALGADCDDGGGRTETVSGSGAGSGAGDVAGDVAASVMGDVAGVLTGDVAAGIVNGVVTARAATSGSGSASGTDAGTRGVDVNTTSSALTGMGAGAEEGEDMGSLAWKPKTLNIYVSTRTVDK